MKTWQIVLIGIGIFLLVIAGIFAYFYSQMQAQSENEDPVYWEKDIAAIESRYNGNIPQDVIVFYGSSSIRKWDSLAEDMAPFTVVNHGFGGSKVSDATHYVDRMVTPYKPQAVVLFTGTNDINGVTNNSKSGEAVYERVVTLFDQIHTDMPDVPIFYISISPTQRRWQVWEEANLANQLIAEYVTTNDKITFIDTTDALLASSGEPNKELYSWDGLHLNEDGYEIWASIIKHVIEAELDQQ